MKFAFQLLLFLPPGESQELLCWLSRSHCPRFWNLDSFLDYREPINLVMAQLIRVEFAGQSLTQLDTPCRS